MRKKWHRKYDGKIHTLSIGPRGGWKLNGKYVTGPTGAAYKVTKGVGVDSLDFWKMTAVELIQK